MVGKPEPYDSRFPPALEEPKEEGILCGTYPIPNPSCFPVFKLLADTLKDQRTKHPKDFPPPKTQDEEFIKDILDADDTVEYLKSVGY